MDAYLTFGTSSLYGGSSYDSTESPIDIYYCQQYAAIHAGISVPKIQPAVAEQLLKKLGYDETENADTADENVPVRSLKTITYRVITKDRLPRQILPEQAGFNGTISRWHEADVFTIFLRLDSRAQSFKILCNEIADQLGLAELRPIENNQVELNSVVLVRDFDDNVHRGRVVHFNEEDNRIERFVLFLIDDGATIEVSKVYELPRSMLLCNNEAAFAYKAQLAGVQSPDGQLVPPKSRYHRLEGRSCRVKQVGIIDDVLRVHLFVQEFGDTEIYVNEQLIHDGLAVRTSEWPARLQTNAEAVSPQEILIDSPARIDIDGRRAQKLVLCGPRSPLHEMLHLTPLNKRNLSEKIVEISSESVNRVMLGATGNSQRFVVSHIHRLSTDNNRLMLLGSTLMPNIDMMLPFVTLVFAPRAQYQCNKKNTAYIGALCGFGPHQSTTSWTRRQKVAVKGKEESRVKQPQFYEEKDLEVEFTHEMTTRDAQLINRIRKLLGEAFGSQGETFDWGEVPARKIQKKLQEATMKFFNTKDRKPINKRKHEFATRACYKWRTLTEEEQKELDELPLRVTLFPPHVLRGLGTEACNDILSLLVDFKESARGHEDEAFISLCPLCLEVFVGRNEVRQHLISAEHKVREAKLIVEC